MSEAWRRVARNDELLMGEPLGVSLDGRQIALYRVQDAVYATGNVCTHAFALLSDGYLDGCEIECPLHNARFDVRTGAALSSPATAALPTYPLRVNGNDLEILLPA